MTVEFIGWSAAILFSICGIPQAVKCYREGRADGMSHLFVWAWFLGEVLMITYVLLKHGFDGPLLTNYVFNIFAILFIMRYLYFPRVVLPQLLELNFCAQVPQTLTTESPGDLWDPPDDIWYTAVCYLRARDVKKHVKRHSRHLQYIKQTTCHVYIYIYICIYIYIWPFLVWSLTPTPLPKRWPMGPWDPWGPMGAHGPHGPHGPMAFT